MNWYGMTPRRVGEPWKEFFAWLPLPCGERSDGARNWIWLERYRERFLNWDSRGFWNLARITLHDRSVIKVWDYP